MTKSMLTGFPNCNEKLPVGTPTETYYFYQFMPIEREANGLKTKVGMPIQVANPQFIKQIHSRFGASAPSILASVKGKVDSFDAAWKNLVVDPPEEPEEVRITDVPGLLVRGVLRVGTKNYDISNLDDLKERLGSGEPIIATLTSGVTSKTFKLVPMIASGCDIPEKLVVRNVDVAEFHRNGLLHMPGLGAAEAQLPVAVAESLVSNGFATVNVKVPGSTAVKKLLVEIDREPTAHALMAQQSAAGPSVRPGVSHSRYAECMVSPFLNPEWIIYAPIMQTWTLTGYERGALINTFSLAPQEQITVEVFSWDRRKKTSELSSSRESETSIESSFSQKVTSEALNEAKNTNGWEFGANTGFEVPQIALKVGANFSIKDINETLQRNTLQNITEGVTKAASKIKSSIQTKVTESQEYGREERITRKFQNPNTGRILHLDCFEVVATYNVSTRYDFANAKLCVLLPCMDFLQNLTNPQTKVRAKSLLALEGMLYEQVPARLQGGFDAARHYLAWDRICEYSCDSECSCDSSPEGTAGSGQGAPAAGNPYEGEFNAAIQAMVAAINHVRLASGKPLADTMGIPATPPGYLDRTDEDKAALRRGFHAYLYKKLVLENLAAGFWSACIDLLNSTNQANAEAVVQRATPQIVDFLNGAIAYASVGVAAIRQLIESLGEFGLNTPFMLAYLGFDDYGLDTAFQNLKKAYDAWKKVEDERKHPPQPDPTAQPAAPAKRKGRSEDTSFSPENMAAVSVNIDALVEYININRSMFRTLIWNSLNPADRMHFLGIFGDVGKYTTPRVLGFVQDNMAVEVDVPFGLDLEKWIRERLLTIKDQAVTFQDVALPVPGMTMQSRLENCDALEPYLTSSRDIELRRVGALAAQEESEALRRSKRIEKDDFGDPVARNTVLHVVNDPS